IIEYFTADESRFKAEKTHQPHPGVSLALVLQTRDHPNIVPISEHSCTVTYEEQFGSGGIKRSHTIPFNNVETVQPGHSVTKAATPFLSDVF
ncbi:hypothetical protein KIPB_013983, partial [Kipferlia bialata]